jgi:hypothetical protein
MQQRELKRYAAYFRGWCQAFGEHEHHLAEENGISWLLSENQAGFVLPDEMIRPLYREVLLHKDIPTLSISQDSVKIGSFQVPIPEKPGIKILELFSPILKTDTDGHLFLTSHLMYGTGARIITFSNKKPVPIIYKQIGSLHIEFL